MSDTIIVDDIKDSTGVAIGRNAKVIIKYILPDTRPEFVDNLKLFNRNFIGRMENLATIDAAFAADESTVTINGIGGNGKTQLALAYAHTRRDKYDIIWRLDADETTTLDNSLRQLGETLGLDIAGKDTPTMHVIVLNRLRESKKDVLLIYDNADKIIPRDLLPYLPSGCHLLITSRRDSSQWGSIAEPLTLGTFTPDEAMAFWQRRMGRELELEEKWEVLGETLGFLPLATEQAAAFMIEEQMNATEYLHEFTQERDALWEDEQPPNLYHDATVATTWKMAFDHAKQTDGAADLLNLLSFFAPDEIPLDVVWAGANRLPDSLATVAADKRKRRKSLKALRTYSLLTVADGKANMHRLVQDVARRQMNAADAWAEAATRVLSKAYRFDQHDMNTWEVCRQLLPHITAVVELATVEGVESVEAARLNNEAGFYLDTYGDYTAALPYYNRALDIKEQQLGSEHPDIVQTLNNLGTLLQAMGEYGEAMPYYARAIAIREKTLGPDHPDVAQSLNNLGALLRAMGEYGKAMPFFHRALDIDEKVLGSDHPNVAIRLNNLGLLLQAMEEYEEARPCFDRALTIDKKALGLDHPNIAIRLNNLGVLLYIIGEYEEAWSYFDRALTINEKGLGSNHPQTAICFNNMGNLLQAIGNYEEARSYLDRALTIDEKVLSPDHLDIARDINSLAVLSAYEGDMQEAARLMRRVLAILEKTVGNNHPNIETARQSLANMEVFQ